MTNTKIVIPPYAKEQIINQLEKIEKSQKKENPTAEVNKQSISLSTKIFLGIVISSVIWDLSQQKDKK